MTLLWVYVLLSSTFDKLKKKKLALAKPVKCFLPVPC